MIQRTIRHCLLELFPPADSDDRNCIRVRLGSIEQSMRSYLSKLRHNILFDKPIKEPDEDREQIVWQVPLHVVNHGADHRAQLLRVPNDPGVNGGSRFYLLCL